MSRQSRTTEIPPGKKGGRKAEPAAVTGLATDFCKLGEIATAAGSVFGGGSIASQIAWLRDDRLRGSQPSALANHIACVQGNQHLQRAIAASRANGLTDAGPYKPGYTVQQSNNETEYKSKSSMPGRPQMAKHENPPPQPVGTSASDLAVRPLATQSAAVLQAAAEPHGNPRAVGKYLDVKAEELSALREELALAGNSRDREKEGELLEKAVRLTALDLMRKYRDQVLATREPTMYGEGTNPTLPHEESHVPTMRRAMQQLKLVAEYIVAHKEDLKKLEDNLLPEAQDLNRLIRQTNPRRGDFEHLWEAFRDHSYEGLEPQHLKKISSLQAQARQAELVYQPAVAWKNLLSASNRLEYFRRIQIQGGYAALVQIQSQYPVFIKLDPDDVVTKYEGDEKLDELRVKAAGAFIRLHQNIDLVIEKIDNSDIHPFDLPKAVEVTRNLLPEHLKGRLNEEITSRETKQFWIGLGLSLLESAVTLIPVVGPALSAVIAVGGIGMSVEDLEDRLKVEKIAPEAATKIGQHVLGVSEVNVLGELLPMVLPILFNFGATWIGREARQRLLQRVEQLGKGGKELPHPSKLEEPSVGRKQEPVPDLEPSQRFETSKPEIPVIEPVPGLEPSGRFKRQKPKKSLTPEQRIEELEKREQRERKSIKELEKEDIIPTRQAPAKRTRGPEVHREEQLFGLFKRAGVPTRIKLKYMKSPNALDPPFASSKRKIGKKQHLDHIVSEDRFRSECKDFARLNRRNQLEVLNRDDNFQVMSASANESKGNKSCKDWKRHEKLDLEVDPKWREDMLREEARLMEDMKRQVEELLPTQGGEVGE